MKNSRTIVQIVALILLAPVIRSAPLATPVREYRGILYNERCLKSQPEWLPYANEHSYQCAMMQLCFLSGYYLVVDEKMVYKLDKRGEMLARRLLLKTKKQDNFRVVVQGRLKDLNMMVQSIEEVK